jgi:hypothetical protein
MRQTQRRILYFYVLRISHSPLFKNTDKSNKNGGNLEHRDGGVDSSHVYADGKEKKATKRIIGREHDALVLCF